MVRKETHGQVFFACGSLRLCAFAVEGLLICPDNTTTDKSVFICVHLWQKILTLNFSVTSVSSVAKKRFPSSLQSVQNYARDVRSGDFPGTAELYTLKVG